MRGGSECNYNRLHKFYCFGRGSFSGTGKSEKTSSLFYKEVRYAFLFLSGEILPEIMIIFPRYLLLLLDHHHHHLKFHQKTEITAATDSSLPSTLVEIYGQESLFIPGPSSRSLQHANRLGGGCRSLWPTSPTQNGTRLCSIPYSFMYILLISCVLFFVC